jgi:hypothetical protein
MKNDFFIIGEAVCVWRAALTRVILSCCGKVFAGGAGKKRIS